MRIIILTEENEYKYPVMDVYKADVVAKYDNGNITLLKNRLGSCDDDTIKKIILELYNKICIS